MICKINTLGTNLITVKGTHHPQGTNSDVFCKFSTCPPPHLAQQLFLYIYLRELTEN